MRGFKWIAAVLCVGLVFSGCTKQEEENTWWTAKGAGADDAQGSSAPEQQSGDAPMFEAPFLMTSFGQSADILMLQKIFDVLSVPITVDALAPPEVIGGYATVIIVVGGSGKGLTAAALTQEDERDRAAAFMQALLAADAAVMVAHVGGDLRIDDFTLELMDSACPAADAFLIVKGGDPAGAIRDYAEEQGKPYYAPGDIIETAPIVRALFARV